MGSTGVGKVAGMRFWGRIGRYMAGYLNLSKVVTTPFLQNLECRILSKHILKQLRGRKKVRF